MTPTSTHLTLSLKKLKKSYQQTRPWIVLSGSIQTPTQALGQYGKRFEIRLIVNPVLRSIKQRLTAS